MQCYSLVAAQLPNATYKMQLIEFHGTWKIWYLKKKSFLNIVVGIWLMSICYLAKILQKCYILHWFQYQNFYFEHPSVRKNGTSPVKMAGCYYHIGNYCTTKYQYLLIYSRIWCAWCDKYWYWKPIYLKRHALTQAFELCQMKEVLLGVSIILPDC